MASAKSIKGGDRVRFVDDERLDMPDAESLHELNYDYISDLAAALFGGSRFSGATLPVGGTLSRLSFDATTPSATTIYGPDGTSTRKAMFFYSYANQSGYHEAQVLVYDPARTGQQTTVDLSSYTAGDTPYIWAKRVDYNTAVDTRKKWVTGSPGSETTFSLATRERYVISFEVTATASAPSADVGWFCVARVVNISAGGAFTFRMVHPFDCGQAPSSSVANDWNNGTAKFSAAMDSSLYNLPFLGTTQALYLLDFVHKTDVASLTSSIATNTTNIATNTAAIATHTTNIATNATNISTNTTSIGRLQTLAPAYIVNLRHQASSPGVWSIYNIESYDGTLVAGSGDASIVYGSNGWYITLTTSASFGFSNADVVLSRYMDTYASTIPPEPYVSAFTLGPPSSSSVDNTRHNLYIFLNTYSNMTTAGNFATFPTSPTNPSGNLDMQIKLYRI